MRLLQLMITDCLVWFKESKYCFDFQNLLPAFFLRLISMKPLLSFNMMQPHWLFFSSKKFSSCFTTFVNLQPRKLPASSVNYPSPISHTNSYSGHCHKEALKYSVLFPKALVKIVKNFYLITNSLLGHQVLRGQETVISYSLLYSN